MNDLNAVPGEVTRIEGQKPPDAMNLHRGHQAGVMHLHAKHGVLHHQALPFLVQRRCVGQVCQQFLDFPDLDQCLGCRRPRPLLATGRVATFQNSAMFCSVKNTSSSWASRCAIDRTAVA